MEKEKLEKYPKTEMYQVIDTIGVPHPYCIGTKHVEMASDHFGGRLGKEAIEAAEEKGASCDICRNLNRKDGRRILSYSEHEQALLIGVKDKRPLNEQPELKNYLLSIKAQTEADGYAGFAFKEEK